MFGNSFGSPFGASAFGGATSTANNPFSSTNSNTIFGSRLVSFSNRLIDIKLSDSTCL